MLDTSHSFFTTINVGIIGLVFGSFANGISYRIPAGESIVRPRSHCPSCKSLIAWYDNIPILSWLILRGRCRNCGTEISWRYPFGELLMAGLFAAITWKLGISWTLVETLILTFGLVTVSFIDFDHMFLPDEFTLSGIMIGLIGSLLSPERRYSSAVLGVIVGSGLLWAAGHLYKALRKRKFVTSGDIKLLAWIGSVLGWQSIPFVFLCSSTLGGAGGLIISWRTRKGLKKKVPFGPYLALAALLYIIYVWSGQEVGTWYFHSFLPKIMLNY